MTEEEAKIAIVEQLKAKSKIKSKFYMKDFYAIVPDWKSREVNKLVNNMVAEGILEYWSSGSTTMIGLKGMGKQHQEED
jgi:hypothetical protein